MMNIIYILVIGIWLVIGGMELNSMVRKEESPNWLEFWVVYIMMMMGYSLICLEN